MEPVTDRPSESSRVQPATWWMDHAIGLVGLALVAAAQAALLLVVLFAPPDDSESVLDVFETHWTDGLTAWWFRLCCIAAFVALLGVFLDRKRVVAGFALLAAFIGFMWPWGI